MTSLIWQNRLVCDGETFPPTFCSTSTVLGLQYLYQMDFKIEANGVTPIPAAMHTLTR